MGQVGVSPTVLARVKLFNGMLIFSKVRPSN